MLSKLIIFPEDGINMTQKRWYQATKIKFIPPVKI